MLLLDRLYDPEHHFWVLPLSPTRVRVGMDPLGIEINGTLAHIVFAPVGTTVYRGKSFGSPHLPSGCTPIAATVP